jgi:diguanylate cyclase
VDDNLFTSDLWKPVLEKYTAVTGLTVELFDVEGRVALGSVHPTPLYALFREYGYEPALFSDCARRCLRQTGARPAVVGVDHHGLTVIGTSLVLDNAIVGAAVTGYALTKFSQVVAVQRWAQFTRLPFNRLWDITRRQPPMPERRLKLYGELLQVLGDALLRENLRTRQYEKVAVQLEAANAAKDDFLAVLSHELRTPLTPILVWASILKNHEGSEQVRKAGEVIERNALLQSRMVEDLLDVNLISHGTVKLDLQSHDLPALIRAALETCAREMVKKEIHVELADASEPLCVKGDTGRLQQIFRNILTNAVKFTPAAGSIRVTLTREAADAIVVVADTGKGIAPEFLPFVFDIFRQQEHGTRREHEGLGIGLALVKRLTELHQGTVTVSSAGVGRGTEVMVRLPLADETSDLDAAAPPDAEPSIAALAGLSILVVEDSDDARESLGNLLQLLGARVTTARDGRDALDVIQGAVPDLVLCDLRMPRMDGYELIHELLRGPSTAHLPVVAMSGLVSEADRQRTLEAGFKAHIAKPFDETTLVAAVSSVIRHP